MKTLFIFRDSYDAKYILQCLNEKKLLEAVIIEQGNNAKKQKLKRLFKARSLLLYPLIVLDITTLVIYSKLITSAMIKRLGKNDYPKDKIKLITDDVNSKSSLDFIKLYKPDIIFIYGTSILKSTFFNNFRSTILNIHSGILPKYRNVHSDFWAYINHDTQNIGISVFFLDEGVDTGDLALQKRIDYKPKDSIADVKIKNLKIIPSLIALAIKKMDLKALPRQKQNEEHSGFYKTPGFSDIIRLLSRFKKT